MAQPKSKYSLPSKVQEPTPEELDPSIGLDIGLFALIKSQIPYYPEMLNLSIENKFWNSSVIMTGAGLNTMHQKLQSETALLHECYGFMDTLNMLELLHFNNRSGSIINTMTLAIIKSRDNKINNKDVDTDKVVNENQDFFNFTQEEDEITTKSFKDFLLENQVIVAFYLFKLVVRFFGIDAIEKEKRQTMSR